MEWPSPATRAPCTTTCTPTWRVRRRRRTDLGCMPTSPPPAELCCAAFLLLGIHAPPTHPLPPQSAVWTVSRWTFRAPSPCLATSRVSSVVCLATSRVSSADLRGAMALRRACMRCSQASQQVILLHRFLFTPGHALPCRCRRLCVHGRALAPLAGGERGPAPAGHPPDQLHVLRHRGHLQVRRPGAGPLGRRNSLAATCGRVKVACPVRGVARGQHSCRMAQPTTAAQRPPPLSLHFRPLVAACRTPTLRA